MSDDHDQRITGPVEIASTVEEVAIITTTIVLCPDCCACLSATQDGLTRSCPKCGAVWTASMLLAVRNGGRV